MSQTSDRMHHSILFPILLPWRMFMHGMRYIFGHPISFAVVLSGASGKLFTAFWPLGR
jgi:hypothetical protein